jgi:hypothetical protein
LLSSWGSGFAAMKPLTALWLAALGLALVHPGKNSRFASAIGLAVLAVAAFDLSQDLFGIDFGFNRWLAPRTTVPGPGSTSLQVANSTALALALAGGSFTLSRFERHRFVATVLGGFAGAIGLFALLGYLAGIDTLYRSVSVNSPPLPTAAGLLCVAGGILLRIGTMPALRQVPAVVAPAGHARMRDRCAAPAVWRIC